MITLDNYRIENNTLYISGTTDFDFITEETSQISKLSNFNLLENQAEYSPKVASFILGNKDLYPINDINVNAIGVLMIVTITGNFEYEIPLNYEEDYYTDSNSSGMVLFGRLIDKINTDELLFLNPVSVNIDKEAFVNNYKYCKDCKININNEIQYFKLALKSTYNIISYNKFHEKILKFIKHINKECKTNMEFINFILNREAMISCFELGYNEEGIKLYDKLINS